VGRVAQPAIGCIADAVDERVRVEARRARQRQHVTIARIQCHGSRIPGGEHALSQTLELEIEGRDDVAAGNRRLLLQHP